MIDLYRNFIFLDTNALNDYYSAIMGGLTDNQQLTTKDTTSRMGNASIKVVGASMGSESESELRKEIILTDAAKFNDLYELMDSNKDIKHLEFMEKTVWDSIRRGNIVEVDVSVRIPDLYNSKGALEDLLPLFNALNSESDPKQKEMMAGIISLMSLGTNDTIPLICEAESNEKYKFVIELPKAFLRVNTENLNGEMTILGKVQKIFPENTEVEVFNMFSSLKPLMKMSKQKVSEEMEQFIEKITGPALRIIPLAIYR